MSNFDQPVMIMAGGTGGHIFPGLAVAKVILDQNVPVIWLGSRHSMEEKLVVARGIEFIGLNITGVRGKGLLAKLMMPVKLLWSVLQACRIILGVRPRAVIGMGGFASAPGGIAAILLRKPLYIQEQNAIPGLTNRWLAKFSYCALEGFEGSFSSFGIQALHSGNPVRQQIEELHPDGEKLQYCKRPLRLLVIGGSLGALHLNQIVPEALSKLKNTLRPETRHQAGRDHAELTKSYYEDAKINAAVTAFIDDMAAAYAWADLVVARAGALTVTELMHAGVASILVPYPHAVDDHQTKNAQILVENNAAILIPDAELTGKGLAGQFDNLLSDKRKLINMGLAARAQVVEDSAALVAEMSLSGERCQEASHASG